MEDLINQKCEACRVGAPKATNEEIDEFLDEYEEWEYIENDEIPQIIRTYEFKDFRDALTFTNEVGELAEREGHHPTILTEWGQVTVMWWTIKIQGIHKNDFIMAAKTEELYNSLRLDEDE